MFVSLLKTYSKLLPDNSEWYLTALLSSLDGALILGCTPPVDILSSHVEVSVHVTTNGRQSPAQTAHVLMYSSQYMY